MTIHAELEQRVGPQRIGVIAVGVATGDLKRSVGTNRSCRGCSIYEGMTPVIDGLGETVNQPDLPVDATQNQGANVRRHRSTVELGAHRQAGDWGKKSQRFWDRIEHGRPHLASPKRSWQNTNYIN
jgi:hypothetical protein